MALAKIKNVVLLTGDVKMHFRAEEVGGGCGFILEKCLNWIVYELKAEYRNIYKPV